MKVQELRIGNYVYYKLSDSEFVRVEGVQRDYPSDIVYIDEITWDYLSVDDLEPLSITKERLIRLGFERYMTKGTYRIKPKRGFEMIVSLDTQTLYLKNNSSGIFTMTDKIKYVHQLQNLCSDFTGRELKMKEQ